jgi:hypothetical protein
MRSSLSLGKLATMQIADELWDSREQAAALTQALDDAQAGVAQVGAAQVGVAQAGTAVPPTSPRRAGVKG